MSDTVKLDRSTEALSLYRRQLVKNDGRLLWLYGSKPHTGAQKEELPPTDPQSSELRFHPLRGEWSIYAAHRQGRTFQPQKGTVAHNPLAPALPGGGPTEIPFDDFEVAVFDNRFASLLPLEDHADSPNDGARQATGRCEVIVYSPEPDGNFATLSAERQRLVVETWIDRYQSLRAAGHAYVIAFENRGAEIGATLHHPHGQIYAFDFIPSPQKRAADAFAGGYDLVADQKNWGAPFEIADKGTMRLVAPPYARFPYEAWIMPKRRVAGPWDYTAEESTDFAAAISDMVMRYDGLFSRPMPYMMTHHAAPRGYEDSFHFTTQFYPILRSKDRIKYLAGIEQATGVFTVDILPEAAASALRESLT